jgi:ATP-binding cassette, subfamily F, member 3
MQYFAQDEATRLDPALTVYETLEADRRRHGAGHPQHPRRLPLLGRRRVQEGGVLSGGERTRLAVARMLLRPSNTLLLDEPTNHLDLDSKDVLLDALEDYGGTLIIVSHDRYFVERLATKIIEVGHGGALVYPGTYEEFLWSKAAGRGAAHGGAARRRREPRGRASASTRSAGSASARTSRCRSGSPTSRAHRRARDRGQALEATMAAPGFYERSRRVAQRRRPAPGVDVGGGRSHGPVGALQEHAAADGVRSVSTPRPYAFVRG